MGLESVNSQYDVVVAGGGITGAGVFSLAVQRGFKALLVESKDFAWGTSSRSSKMIHGGLRYLKQGKFLMTRAAVREREKLLKIYPGLIRPLHFMMPIYNDYGPSQRSMKLGLSIYSGLASEKQHELYNKDKTLEDIPWIRKDRLVSAVGFKDAQVDDARLVLRLIQDACADGGTALNYTSLCGIVRDHKKRLAAVQIKDEQTGAAAEVKTKVLINATGIFAERLNPLNRKGLTIRPLRGSHLIFPSGHIHLEQVISFIHPSDLRPVFLFPWKGCILLGTTDVDHEQAIDDEPFIKIEEARYLMEGLNYILPGVPLTLDDCTSSIAGVRPVLSKGKKSASKESREHAVWKDKGVISVTGGKLTTFRLLAKDALKAAKKYLPEPETDRPDTPADTLPADSDLNSIPASAMEKIIGSYGALAVNRFAQYDEQLFDPIPGTPDLWAQFAYAAQYEQVKNLSDLMLRRVRTGLLLSMGGKEILGRIETICKPYLDWDNLKWHAEKKSYLALWNRCYAPPNPGDKK